MRLFFSRYPGLLSRNATWKLFSRPKPAWNPGFNNARIGAMQTRQMAHIVPPSQSRSDLDEKMVVQVETLLSHFGDLFDSSPPDLAERLMSTITPNPSSICAIALTYSLYDAESLDASIRSVVHVLSRTADIMVKESHSDEPRTFRDMLISSIKYLLWREVFIFQAEQVTDNTTYSFLHAALFSASAVKNGLLDADLIYAFTRTGLLLSDSETLEANRKRNAVMRAGACLQLITAGSIFMEKHFAMTGSSADIIAELEALRVKRSIAHPRGLELLEKTIEAAKSNFANPLSAEDAWKILSPPDNCFWEFFGGDEWRQ